MRRRARALPSLGCAGRSINRAPCARRPLTILYNQHPAWLAQAHDALDAAVAAAYGWADWTPAMTDDDILRRLLALNLARSKDD